MALTTSAAAYPRSPTLDDDLLLRTRRAGLAGKSGAAAVDGIRLTFPTPNALYCSTLIGLVVARATGYDLSSDTAHQPLHPGTLAAHPELTDVMLEWRHL
jgi:hypothetical protein